MRDVWIHDGVQLNEALRTPTALPRTASACGKAILFGEHFVVHGVPALAVPVSGRRVTVTVTRATSDDADHIGPPEVVAAMPKMLSHLGRDPDAIKVSVASTLPIAAGLGSSAALAVALVRALGETEPERIRALAHGLEVLAHGTPSGIDDAVATYERALVYERGAFTWLDGDPPPLWVATVSRTRSTRDAVLAVHAWRAAHPEAFDALSRMAAELVTQAMTAWHARDHAALGAHMDRAHALLAELGVVDPRQEALVAAARAAGALGAKLTGAGFGGAILVLAPARMNLEPVLRAAGADEVFFAGVAT